MEHFDTQSGSLLLFLVLQLLLNGQWPTEEPMVIVYDLLMDVLGKSTDFDSPTCPVFNISILSHLYLCYQLHPLGHNGPHGHGSRRRRRHHRQRERGESLGVRTPFRMPTSEIMKHKHRAGLKNRTSSALVLHCSHQPKVIMAKPYYLLVSQNHQ